MSAGRSEAVRHARLGGGPGLWRLTAELGRGTRVELGAGESRCLALWDAERRAGYTIRLQQSGHCAACLRREAEALRGPAVPGRRRIASRHACEEARP